MKIASLTPKEWFSGQLVQIKPKLRGWLHLGAAPLSLAASIVLVCLAPTTPTKIGSAVYLACSLILFGVSAAYHRFYWARAGKSCGSASTTPTSSCSLRAPTRRSQSRSWTALTPPFSCQSSGAEQLSVSSSTSSGPPHHAG